MIGKVIVAAGKRLPIKFKSLPVVGKVARDIEFWIDSSPPFNQITRGLFVGDSRAAREYGVWFDNCISVADGLEYESTSHSFDLVPTGSAQTAEFADAVEAVVAAIYSGESTLVHCHEGRERAPTVVATALAAICDKSFSQSIEFVREKRGIAEPTQELRDSAWKYLEAERGGADA